MLRPIEARGAIETAKRVRQRISATFIYAVAQGWRAPDAASLARVRAKAKGTIRQIVGLPV